MMIDRINEPRDYSSAEGFFARQEIKFTHIHMKQMSLDQVPKSYQEYTHKMGLPFRVFREPCGKIDYSVVKVFSPFDLTFGAFLLMKAATFHKNCGTCETNHREQYYFANHVLNIEVEKISQENNVDGTGKSLFEEMAQ